MPHSRRRSRHSRRQSRRYSWQDEPPEYTKQTPSMLPLHNTVPAVRGLWATGRRGSHWYPAKCCVFLRDMCMEEKAEVVQERSLQRKTNFRVLPRGDPSMGDEKSEYTKQKPSMLPMHNQKEAIDQGRAERHYERNESTSMPGTVAEECTDAAQYAVYSVARAGRI